MNQVQVNQYPQLKSILWDIHVDLLDEDIVFEYYETRWRYIDAENIQENEAQIKKILLTLW